MICVANARGADASSREASIAPSMTGIRHALQAISWGFCEVAMIARSAPSKRQMIPHIGRALFALALTTIMCSASDESPACWSNAAYARSDDSKDVGCVPEPAGQTCDPSTQRCESVCAPSEYLLVCRTRASVAGSPIATLRASYVPAGRTVLPTPGAGLDCGPTRVPVPPTPNQTLYCCRCTG
jgi:hypothetical protein